MYIKEKSGITLIALVITIIVMIILAAVGLTAAFGDNGLIKQTISGRKESQKAQIYFDTKHKVVDIIAKAEADGLSKEETNAKIDEFFQSSEGKKLLEKIKKEYNLDTIEQAKEKVLNDIENEKSNNQTALPPIKDEDRAPMIISMDLKKGIVLPVTQFPDNCYIDWGDGEKSRSLTSPISGKQDVKIYGNFNKAQLGDARILNKSVNKYPTDPNANIDVTARDISNFTKGILEIKDWGENNFSGIIFDKNKISEYATPRERSFENIKVIYKLFSSSSITKIDPKLFANAPKLEQAEYVFQTSVNLRGPIPEQLFANCPNLESVYAAFHGANEITGPIPENLFANNKKLKDASRLFYMCYEMRGPIPEKLFANNTELLQLERAFCKCSKLNGPIPKNLIANNKKLQTIVGLFQSCYALEGEGPEIWQGHEGLDWSRVYSQAENLSNYNDLPSEATD